MRSLLTLVCNICLGNIFILVKNSICLQNMSSGAPFTATCATKETCICFIYTGMYGIYTFNLHCKRNTRKTVLAPDVKNIPF